MLKAIFTDNVSLILSVLLANIENGKEISFPKDLNQKKIIYWIRVSEENQLNPREKSHTTQTLGKMRYIRCKSDNRMDQVEKQK